jgi:ankyrin repeat protein
MKQIPSQNRHLFPTVTPVTGTHTQQATSNPEETLKRMITSICPDLGTDPIENYLTQFRTFTIPQKNQLIETLSKIKEGLDTSPDPNKRDVVKQVITKKICFIGQLNDLSQLLNTSQMALTTDRPFEKSLNELIIRVVDKIAFEILNQINNDIFKGFPDEQSAHQLEPIKHWLDKNFLLYDGKYPEDAYNSNNEYTNNLIAKAFENITQSTPFDLDFWAKHISDIMTPQPNDYPGFADYVMELLNISSGTNFPEGLFDTLNQVKADMEELKDNSLITLKGHHYLPTKDLLKELLKTKLQESAQPTQPTDAPEFSGNLGQFCLRNGIKGAVVDTIQKDDEGILSALKNIPDNWTETEVLLLFHVISKREDLLASITNLPANTKLAILHQFPMDTINQPTLAHFVAYQGLDGCLDVLHALGMDLDTQNLYGQTPLHLAAQHGHVQVVERLLKNEADPKIKAQFDKTPLHLAAQHGHVQVVELLLQKNADPDIKDKEGNNPLLIAAEKGYVKVVELLLQKKAAKDIQDKNLKTPLHLAAQNENLDMVKLLLENGANPNIQDQDGKTPLYLAAQNGHANVVERLLDRGADPKIKAQYDKTPLHLAAQNGHANVVERLLDRGADPDIKDKEGNNPLLIAAEKGYVKVVELLLQKKAEKDIQDKFKFTPLHLAAKNGRANVVELLLQNNADPKIKSQFCTIPLHLAARNGHAEVVKLLIPGIKTFINSTDKQGCTPLHLAAQEGNLEMVKLLLNSTDKQGCTPLHLAAQEGDLEMVKLLLDCFPDKDIQDKNRKTPLHIQDKNRKTPLHLAAEKGHVKVVTLLLEYKANKDIKDRNNKTPLNLAAEKGHVKVVKLLLEYKANKDIKDRNNKTPLNLEAQNGHANVVNLLKDSFFKPLRNFFKVTNSRTSNPSRNDQASRFTPVVSNS